MSESEPMGLEEGNRNEGPKFSVITLRGTGEVMVVASDWLTADQKRCHWPPFKSPERYSEAVKNSLHPATGGKPWEKLNVLFHAEYDTYEAALNGQEEQKAMRDGRILYNVVTLQDSNELTVIPAMWLNEEKTECYWPPFRTPEMCTEAVTNRLEPLVERPVETLWKKLNIQVHAECATYRQAKERQKSLKEHKERTDSVISKYPLLAVPTTSTFPHGAKRKRLSEAVTNHSVKWALPLLTTEMEIMLKAKQIMKRVTDNSVHTIIMHRDIISKINKMNNVSRKKATIGIFGKSGEGKSSLLSAVLGKQDLLPSGCFGACTAVVTQVEANLDDSNYIAEIELLSKEDWEKELEDIFRVLSDDSEDRNDDLMDIAEEKITALYGEDADKKTLEELKREDKFAEIENFLSDSKKTISNRDVLDFANDVACYILHSQSSPGGWYWPLVKSVTFKVPDCHELLEHIVLVDIPGTGDCNKNRDDTWKTKLRECCFVWIVSDINRAITDKDPWGILKHCIEELGPGGECKSINFICTKTDDINPSAYIRQSRLTRDQSSGDKDQKKVCILHRNEQAKTRVKEKFENSEIKKRFRTDDNFLKVFTVSSNAFFDHTLNLEPSETEIPKLWDELRILNKSISRELTRDYVSEAKGVLSLIQSVQLDTNKKTAEMKVKVHGEFKKNLMKALNELEKYFDSIYIDLEKCLSKGVEESVQQCVASTEEVIAPNNGYCWSEQLGIDEYFNQIFSVSGTTGKSVREQIEKFSIIQSNSAYQRSPLFQHIHDFIKMEETKLKASLNTEVVDMKKDIYSSMQTTIERAMASCYEEAAAVRGPGSMKKQQHLLIDTVDLKKYEMFKKAKIEVLKKLNNLKLYIKDALESGLEKAMELSLSQTGKIKWIDVSKEIEELERLSDLLSD